MGAQALPPPGQGDQQPQASPGGGMVSPAPAQPDQGGAEVGKMIIAIAQAGRMIAMKVPGAVQEVREIGEILQRIQRKMVGSQPAAEPAAPPV